MTKASQSQTGSWRHRGAWRAVAWVLTVYVIFVLMFAFLQRSLIYLPSRESSIEPSDAGMLRGQVHDITILSDDQIELHGWHVLADGHRAADRAQCDRQLALGRYLVLYFSGNAGNRRYRPSEFGIFTGLGTDVFIVDYRGYGDNSGSPSENRLASDAHSLWNYATQERGVTADRIVLYGESLGGGVAIRLAAELAETGTVPAAVIVRSTFSSLVEVGEYHYPFLPVRWALIDRFDSGNRIARVQCPILQIHGSRDAIIPIELGRRLFESAPDKSSSGIPKQFAELRDAGHNDITFVANTELRATIGPFLDKLQRQNQ